MAATKAALARFSLAVRADFGLREVHPFDPFAWSEENGIPFISLRDFVADEAAMRRFLDDKPQVWSAALVRDGRSHLVIYNPERSPERTRSDLTHEIAHFEAEHEPSPAWTDDSGGCDGASRSQEREAAELAAAILIPVNQARAAATRGDSPEAVATRYQVSVEMATWRMNVSGGYLIAQRAAAKRAGASTASRRTTRLG